MKINQIFIFFVLLISVGCKNNSNEKKEILFLYRTGSGFNDYSAYDDMLLLHNYEDTSMSGEDLYKIARLYEDTVKADKPVEEIYFIKDNSLISVPKRSMDSGLWSDLMEYTIITFGFRNKDIWSMEKPVELFSITLWNNSKYKTFYVRKEKKSIDSILRLTFTDL
jgi:hypothetical protein